ncbi:ABC drug efflux pump, inner membrane subunit, DrrB family [Streptomyces sp. L-9-10]|nr:ABC drug efflux pump, inner membrane subunit, DrrB family [Streptomyces sp. L-9-10]
MMNFTEGAIRARGLTVRRGDRTVLRGLDFAVSPGRITGLLGPSGCGKSTLMRAVVGTQAKVTGTLDVLGLPAGDGALRARIGYVTQAPSVYDDLTVRQNLDYFAAVLDPGRARRAARRETVTRAIGDVDLASHADSLAGRLSGGQRSRVSLAVALLGTPELLVLDEPTVGLDPVLRRDLWELFHRIAAERAATILVSSHGRRGQRTPGERPMNTATPGTATVPGTTAPSRTTPAPMSAARTLATAARVLRQLRHDPRSIALMILVPCVMLFLLRYVFDGSPRTFDAIGASLLGIFPLITMFLVTSIATLRERTSGTLERLLAMPLGKADLIAGYALAFGLLALVQSVLATGLAVWALGLDVVGSAWLLLLVALLDALLGTALGLFVSAFAASEFQAVQFMPAVIFPQLLLCGLFAPRPTMQPVLEAISNVLPMSYAVDGMNEVLRHTDVTGDFVRDAVIVAGCAALVLALGAATLRRRTA